MSTIRLRLAAMLLGSAVLCGCAVKKPVTLYQWGDYQKNVDAYLRADKIGPEEQTQHVEEDLKKIQATGGVIPPGYQAHLGLLYAQQGRFDKFSEQIQYEKTQFPESESFMDFLVRNFKK